ncbi:sigma-54-dependent transcriptional regulator [Roseovarius aquimarinus]|uniref:Sigma-54-dependent transcriptional regulator n=1 Tax=Roseovarius aquimarinus TaxID=1229156 RepID=A0ABW7I9S2_9RHOB
MTDGMTGARILVVEDDDDHRIGLCDLLDAAGHAPVPHASALDALEDLERADIILTDLRMPRMSGMEFLDEVKARRIDAPVILLTGHGDVEHAVRAMRAGAEDFLEKPYDVEHLLAVISRALRVTRMTAELSRLRDAMTRGQSLMGDSPALVAAREALMRVAPLDLDVVLTGQTGTGKELAARILHGAGPVLDGPFVALNCAALPEAGFEADLFGIALGFSDAQPEGRPGRIEMADGGTLFLDRIDALPLGLQPKLARVLESRSVDRLGGRDSRSLRFRVISSAAPGLRQRAQDGTFREDLFYRIAGIEIALPRLAEMGGDVATLFEHFVQHAALRHGVPPVPISISDRRKLAQHDWPGNVRELKAVAERFALGLAPLAASEEAARSGTLKERVARFEAQEITRTLQRCHGSSTRAARELGLPKRTLNAKIARAGLRGAASGGGES